MDYLQADKRDQQDQKKTPKMAPKDIKKRVDKLKGERGLWESHWQELADYLNPRRNNVTTKQPDGAKRNKQVLDNTGMVATEMLAGALHGMLTNPSVPWLEYTTNIRAIDEKAHVARYLENRANITLDVMNSSNFQTELHQFYLDITSLCTSVMQVEEDPDYYVRFASQHIATVFIEENNKGLVNEVYRCFEWTARNIVAEFGEEAAFKYDFIKQNYEKNSDDKFEIIHAVYPTPTGFPSAHAFISQYIICRESYADNSEFLSEGGFHEFPYIVSRWAKSSGEKYGRGPGTNALPEQKLLNKMVETTIKGAQKSVDPPLQAPDDGVVLPLRLTPGGITYKRAGSDEIKPIFDNYRIDFGFQAMESHRARVREAFYVDQLQLNQGPQMTATEVMQRTEEKMRMMGPLLGRQEFEFLAPLITRVSGILERRNMFGPMPDELKNLKIKAKYKSTISRSQKIGELNSILKGLQAIEPIAQFIPDILDNFDADGYYREVARIQSFPSVVSREKKDVIDIRKSKQQGQQAALQQQNQTQAVDNVSKLQKAIPNGGQQ